MIWRISDARRIGHRQKDYPLQERHLGLWHYQQQAAPFWEGMHPYLRRRYNSRNPFGEVADGKLKLSCEFLIRGKFDRTERFFGSRIVFGETSHQLIIDLTG